MTASDTIADYVAAWEAARDHLPGDADWTRDLRGAAIDRFRTLGLPNPRMEAWKYTKLSPLNQAAFVPAEGPEIISGRDVGDLVIEGLDGPELVFVNGRWDGDLSRTVDLPDGCRLVDLAEALAADDAEVRALLSAVHDDDALTQLNTAMMRDGFLLHVAGGVTLDAPLQVIHVAHEAARQAAHTRLLVVLEAGAAATVIETFAGDDDAYWTNTVLQARIGENAALTHWKRQREGRNAVHVARGFVHLDAGARYRSLTLSTGAEIARNETRVAMAGPAADARLAGVQLARSGQSLDTLTFVDHAVADTTSGQTFKAVLARQAKTAFQGKVLVQPDAQHTDARQSSNNLLLDRSAEANTKPELEIYADDVQCAHGATVGELSADALFYLTSRGLDPEAARALLVDAFIADVLEAIEDETVRQAFAADAAGWMNAEETS